VEDGWPSFGELLLAIAADEIRCVARKDSNTYKSGGLGRPVATRRSQMKTSSPHTFIGSIRRIEWKTFKTSTRRALTAAGLVAVTVTFSMGGHATAATRPGGVVKLWAATENGNSVPVVLTGAIGDYGHVLSVNSAGKIDANGNFAKLILTKGTIILNSTTANAEQQTARPTDANAATCSGSVVTTAPNPIVRGTGAYAGVTGSIAITETFAFVGPFTKSGKCDAASGHTPAGMFTVIVGAGNVDF